MVPAHSRPSSLLRAFPRPGALYLATCAVLKIMLCFPGVVLRRFGWGIGGVKGFSWGFVLIVLLLGG